jgi:hypothetical protein
MRKSHVIIIFKSPAYSSITNTLLSLLQFFKQAEVTWNNCNGAALLQHTIIFILQSIYIQGELGEGNINIFSHQRLRMGSMCNTGKNQQLGSTLQSGFLGHELLYSQNCWYAK